MTQTHCDRSDFLVPMRWLLAGDDPSRPNYIYQCAVRPLMRPQAVSKCPGHSPDLPCVQTCSWCPAGVPSAIDLGADIKSP